MGGWCCEHVDIDPENSEVHSQGTYVVAYQLAGSLEPDRHLQMMHSRRAERVEGPNVENHLVPGWEMGIGAELGGFKGCSDWHDWPMSSASRGDEKAMRRRFGECSCRAD